MLRRVARMRALVLVLTLTACASDGRGPADAGSSSEDSTCKPYGATCSYQDDCCSGICNGTHWCSDHCTAEGHACYASNECCDALPCTNGTCGSSSRCSGVATPCYAIIGYCTFQDGCILQSNGQCYGNATACRDLATESECTRQQGCSWR